MRCCVDRLPLVCVCVFIASLVRLTLADDPPRQGGAEATLQEKVRGAWVVYRETPNGRFMTIKEHRGDHTVVTTYDPNKMPIHSHRSEYSIDASGAVPVFRYRNKVVLIGPNAGAKDERESAYAFRLEGDRFYEVQGLLPGDSGEPKLIIWERLKDHPVPKPQT